MSNFKHPVGSWVTWVSQSQGSVKAKTGTVLAHVPAHTSILNHEWFFRKAKKSHIKFDVKTASFDRYLVAVQVGRNVHYYAPRRTVVDREDKE